MLTFRDGLWTLTVLWPLCLAACGSPFIEGWRDETPDERTPAERCEAREGWTWKDEACVQVETLALTELDENQCAKRAGHVWLDARCQDVATLDEGQCGHVVDHGFSWFAGRCMPREEAACLSRGEDRHYVGNRCIVLPPLEAKGGALRQTVAKGQAIQAIELGAAPGLMAALRRETCPGFFALANNALSSNSSAALPADVKQCEIDVVATAFGRDSRPLHVVVRIEAGFLELCRHKPTDAVRRTIAILADKTNTAECEATAKALTEAEALDLTTDPRAASQVVDLSPLTGLPRLKVLKLSGNIGVQDLRPLQSLSGLRRLELVMTSVEDLSPLASHPSLEFLNMDGTPLDRGTVAKTRQNCPTGEDVNREVHLFCSAPPR